MAPKLLKLAPTLLTLLLVAWVVWPHLPLGSSEAPVAAAKPQAAEKTKPNAKRSEAPPNPFDGVLAMLLANAQARDTKKGPAVAGTVAAAGTPTTKDAPGRAEEPPEVIQDMTLSATIIRGKKRIAMIDGKIYEQGDTIRDAGDAATDMQIARVEPRRVIITKGRRRLALSYSNTLSSAKPLEELPGEHGTGKDPDVAAAIANNSGPELGLLRSLLASPMGSSLANFAGSTQAPSVIPRENKAARPRPPHRYIVEEELGQ
jgi:hypothetical protein